MAACTVFEYKLDGFSDVVHQFFLSTALRDGFRQLSRTFGIERWKKYAKSAGGRPSVAFQKVAFTLHKVSGEARVQGIFEASVPAGTFTEVSHCFHR